MKISINPDTDDLLNKIRCATNTDLFENSDDASLFKNLTLINKFKKISNIDKFRKVTNTLSSFYLSENWVVADKLYKAYLDSMAEVDERYVDCIRELETLLYGVEKLFSPNEYRPFKSFEVVGNKLKDINPDFMSSGKIYVFKTLGNNKIDDNISRMLKNVTDNIVVHATPYVAKVYFPGGEFFLHQ